MLDPFWNPFVKSTNDIDRHKTSSALRDTEAGCKLSPKGLNVELTLLAQRGRSQIRSSRNREGSPDSSSDWEVELL